MERIIIKHLKGSKADQVEQFPLEHFQKLTIGRTPESTVKYDPSQDDLVSRVHAEIRRDKVDGAKFTITDLHSRNGTYVNKRRINGTTSIMPGDVIQLGPGGPAFQFDVAPRPATTPPLTRVAEGGVGESLSDNLPPTREALQRTPLPSSDQPSAASPSIGRNTVERLISQSKDDVRKHLVNGAAVLLGVVVLITGLFVSKHRATQEIIARTQQELTETKAHASTPDPALVALREVMSRPDIAKNYGPATVFIEAGWKLISTTTGGQLYHQYYQHRKKRLPAYVLLEDGTVEPFLAETATDLPIGTTHTGSGFAVAENGFLLTNRHVAATWETRWGGMDPSPRLPGWLFETRNGKVVNIREFPSSDKDSKLLENLLDWVPAKTKSLGGKPASGKFIEGRHDYLDVTFPKNKLRIPARLVRVSDTADVALIKIDVPQSLTKVQVHNNYEAIHAGSEITVLGYPAVSPPVEVRVKSQDPMNRKDYWTMVPDPTLTPGNLGRIIRGEATPAGGAMYDYRSEMGDVYQLTINTTGPGNSGGPVFDDRGRVVGIFTYGKNDQAGTHISFAVPIKYGLDLMSIQTVLK